VICCSCLDAEESLNAYQAICGHAAPSTAKTSVFSGLRISSEMYWIMEDEGQTIVAYEIEEDGHLCLELSIACGDLGEWYSGPGEVSMERPYFQPEENK
jgi:hypothetical protein